MPLNHAAADGKSGMGRDPFSGVGKGRDARPNIQKGSFVCGRVIVSLLTFC